MFRLTAPTLFIAALTILLCQFEVIFGVALLHTGYAPASPQLIGGGLILGGITYLIIVPNPLLDFLERTLGLK